MKMQSLLLRGVAISAAACLLVGCNTVRGVGRDVERAGEVIQGRSAQATPAAELLHATPTPLAQVSR